MKPIFLLLALPVAALTGCSTYVGDAGPGYYDGGYYAGGPSYYSSGPVVDVGLVGYDHGGGYYHHDYHHTDSNYHSVVAANSHSSFHAASNTRVASAIVSHVSGHSGGGRTASASVNAGHERH